MVFTSPFRTCKEQGRLIEKAGLCEVALRADVRSMGDGFILLWRNKAETKGIEGFSFYQRLRRGLRPRHRISPKKICAWEPRTATVNRELATLSHLFNKAVEWRWLDRPAPRPKKLGESAGRIIALTDEQCDALMTAAVGSAEPYLWLFVAFGLNTAMRHSEIMVARWDQFDLANRWLFIPDAMAGEREQPITPELAELLLRERDMRDDRKGWIFLSPHADGAAGHRARMDRPFRDAAIRVGLDPALITLHVMRHTAITKLVQDRVDLPTVQRIGGHKTVAMVLRPRPRPPYRPSHPRDRANNPTTPASKLASAITHDLHPRSPPRPRSGVAAKPKLTAV